MPNALPSFSWLMPSMGLARKRIRLPDMNVDRIGLFLVVQFFFRPDKEPSAPIVEFIPF